MAFFIFRNLFKEKLKTKSSMREMSYQGDLKELQKCLDVFFNAQRMID